MTELYMQTDEALLLENILRAGRLNSDSGPRFILHLDGGKVSRGKPWMERTEHDCRDLLRSFSVLTSMLNPCENG